MTCSYLELGLCNITAEGWEREEGMIDQGSILVRVACIPPKCIPKIAISFLSPGLNRGNLENKGAWIAISVLIQGLQFILSLSDERCYERHKIPCEIKQDLPGRCNRSKLVNIYSMGWVEASRTEPQLPEGWVGFGGDGWGGAELCRHCSEPGEHWGGSFYVFWLLMITCHFWGVFPPVWAV